MTDQDVTRDLSVIQEQLQAQSSAQDAIPAADALQRLSDLRERRTELEDSNLAENSKTAYAHDQERYGRWCKQMGLPPLPVNPEIVSLYLTDLSELIRSDGKPAYKVTSLRRVVSSLARLQYDTGGGRGLGDHELIARTINGLANERQERAEGRAALLTDDVLKVISHMDHSTWPAGVSSARDTLVLLVGFATALRRENVAGLTAGNLTIHPHDGIHVRVGRTKTDQTGRGALLAVPYGQVPATCAPCAWFRWASLLAADTIEERMALVLSTPRNPDDWQHVCRGAFPELPDDAPVVTRVTKSGRIMMNRVSGTALYKRLLFRLENAGYAPDRYGFHSLRAGFVTQALIKEATHKAIRNQTLHKTDMMVDHYDRDNLPLRNNAVTKLGL